MHKNITRLIRLEFRALETAAMGVGFFRSTYSTFQLDKEEVVEKSGDKRSGCRGGHQQLIGIAYLTSTTCTSGQKLDKHKYVDWF